MRKIHRMISLAIAMSAATAAVAAPPTVASMQGARRVLLVSAPDGADPGLQAQQKSIAGWRKDAAARDVTAVLIVGDKVEGAGDTAAALRGRYDLPEGKFAVALIGKDGTVAVRSAKPVVAAELTRTIDAMPMRRAGQR